MSRVVTYLVAAGILVLAGVVVAVEPPEQLQQGPFVVDTTLGVQATGRNIEATIFDVRLAEVVELDQIDGWRGASEGVWVVATITAATRVEPGSLNGFLLIDGLEFRESERMDLEGLESWQLVPGIPTAGTVLFEIPRDLAQSTTHARLMLGLNSDWRLDSLVATTVDLAALTIQPVALVAPAERVAP